MCTLYFFSVHFPLTSPHFSSLARAYKSLWTTFLFFLYVSLSLSPLSPFSLPPTPSPPSPPSPSPSLEPISLSLLLWIFWGKFYFRKFKSLPVLLLISIGKLIEKLIRNSCSNTECLKTIRILLATYSYFNILYLYIFYLCTFMYKMLKNLQC